MKYVGSKADTQVMQSMAKLLTQDNPGALQVAIQQASKTPAYMEALEKLSMALGAPVRGAALSISDQ
jgi:phosphoribosylcarboxyaminoimidazole (NCAIR) mutase